VRDIEVEPNEGRYRAATARECPMGLRSPRLRPTKGDENGLELR